VKVGDLVKYLSRATGEEQPEAGALHGLVIAVSSGNDRRVKWFSHPHPYWVSQKNLEVVNESR